MAQPNGGTETGKPMPQQIVIAAAAGDLDRAASVERFDPCVMKPCNIRDPSETRREYAIAGCDAKLVHAREKHPQAVDRVSEGAPRSSLRITSIA